MFLEPLTPTEAGALPGELLTELTALYASNHAFHALSGDFPDPEDIRPEQVATALADELADPDVEVLLARSAGRLVPSARSRHRPSRGTRENRQCANVEIDAFLTALPPCLPIAA